MKAEHRKELMTNSLANRLGEAIQNMKEGPSRGTTLLLVAVGLILIVVFAWRYFSNSAEESDSARWLKWDSLSSPKQLESFAEDPSVQGQTPGRLARLEEARRNLHDGLSDLGGFGTTRTEALEKIKKAAGIYEKLVDECADKPLLHQQVLMGSAKSRESLGEIEQARKYYNLLKQKYADTVFGKEATEQLKRLDTAAENGDLNALREEYNKTAP
jgi:hypothetical protein